MTDLRKVDVNLLVVLDAILTERNLTRAGDALGMTQPAVSGALARLRQQFDDPILVRQGRTFELTEKGEELVPVVADAMTEVSRLLDLSPVFEAETSTRTFMISGSDYVLSQMTPVLLRLLKAKAPNVHIEFDYLPVSAVASVDDLLRRDVLIAGAGTGLPGKKHSLFSDTFVCIADQANPNLVDDAFTLDDLAELRHVRSGFVESVSTLVDEMLVNAGVSAKVAVNVLGFLPVPHVVAGTNMIGFVPERLALQTREALGLVIAETPVKGATLVEAAYWHPSKTTDPAIAWLVALLREAAELLEFGAEE